MTTGVPTLRIVRGEPDSTEIAALIIALLTVGADHEEPAAPVERPSWISSEPTGFRGVSWLDR